MFHRLPDYPTNPQQGNYPEQVDMYIFYLWESFEAFNHAVQA